MGLIDKATILAAKDIKTEDVLVSEWSGSVRVRELSAGEVVGFWEACRDAEGKLMPSRVQPELLVRAVVGEDDNPLFTPADISKLMEKSSRNINLIFEAAQRLNGIGDEAEEIAKNSGAVQSGG